MQLFTSVGPNPRVVRMFLIEKQLTIPETTIDLVAGENRQPDYLAINPAGTTPALRMPDGSYLTEITAICEYLEELHPDPPLIGRTPDARAKVRMWTRRVDLKVCEPLASGFRFAEGLPMFENRMRCLPEAAAGLKAIARDGLAWIEQQLDDRPFLAGDTLSLADILLFAFVSFGNQVGQPLDSAHRRLNRWLATLSERESAKATAG